MQWDILFFFNSVLLGVGLAMDAFSVSLANGLNEPRMSRRRMLGIAGVFAGFQALMPMTGWICVHTIVQYFRAFEKLIPWIALALLGFIGGKMLWEAFTEDEDEDDEEEECFMTNCPECEEEVYFDESVLEDGEVICPNCGAKLEFDLSDLANDEDEDQE